MFALAQSNQVDSSGNPDHSAADTNFSPTALPSGSVKAHLPNVVFKDTPSGNTGESSSKAKGSLIEDYADPNLEQPSHMDMED
jgi:hypothetical protein